MHRKFGEIRGVRIRGMVDYSGESSGKENDTTGRITVHGILNVKSFSTSTPYRKKRDSSSSNVGSILGILNERVRVGVAGLPPRNKMILLQLTELDGTHINISYPLFGEYMYSNTFGPLESVLSLGKNF